MSRVLEPQGSQPSGTAPMLDATFVLSIIIGAACVAVSLWSFVLLDTATRMSNVVTGRQVSQSLGADAKKTHRDYRYVGRPLPGQGYY
jgi:hypothetical protein